MNRPSRGLVVELLLLALALGFLVYYFGWHEFDAVRSWLRGG